MKLTIFALALSLFSMSTHAQEFAQKMKASMKKNAQESVDVAVHAEVYKTEIESMTAYYIATKKYSKEAAHEHAVEHVYMAKKIEKAVKDEVQKEARLKLKGASAEWHSKEYLKNCSVNMEHTHIACDDENYYSGKDVKMDDSSRSVQKDSSPTYKAPKGKASQGISH